MPITDSNLQLALDAAALAGRDLDRVLPPVRNASSVPSLKVIAATAVLLDKSTRLGQALRDATPAQRAWLSDVAEHSLGYVAQITRRHVRSGDAWRSAHDRIQRLAPGRAAGPILATRVFDNFIRGVTYFADEDPRRGVPSPIYHRLYSCGPRDPAHREGSRGHRIERCYVERLIYDAIYSHLSLRFPTSATQTFAGQDEGHLFRLDLTKADFATCFPDVEIDVQLHFTDQNWPDRLVVTRVQGAQSSQLVYTRRLYLTAVTGWEYDDAVECVRTDDHAGVRTIRTNSSTFRLRGQFIDNGTDANANRQSLEPQSFNSMSQTYAGWQASAGGVKPKRVSRARAAV
jgi:hypothetical protein